MIMEMSLLVIIIAALSIYVRNIYCFFSKRGIPCAPIVPILGSLWRSIFWNVHNTEDLMRIYREIGADQCRYIGFYHFTTPIVLLKDLDLIKKITVKNFDHFTDHLGVGSTNDEIITQNMFLLKGQKWHNIRAALSPAFTSLKLKNMYSLISECGTQMTNYLTECCGASDRAEVDLNDLISRYTADNIASTFFGLQVNSFRDKGNQFYRMAKKITNFSKWFKIIYILNLWFPKIGKFLKLTMFPKEVYDYYNHLVLDAMAYREKEKIIRPDMIHLLMEAKKGSLKHETTDNDKDTRFATVQKSENGNINAKSALNNADLVSQAMGFLYGGLDSTSNTLSFIMYEIAVNQDVHIKLQNEIDDFINAHGRKHMHTYEMIQQLKYVDMVVTEGLRKWATGYIDRVCVKDYNLGPYKAGGESYTIHKGDVLWIPILGVQRDARYWENPEKFNPERFSDENKKNILSLTYLPFGNGPRVCIGYRFALVEMKTFLIHFLADFDIKPSSKTPKKIVLARDNLKQKSKEDFHLKITKRKYKTN